MEKVALVFEKSSCAVLIRQLGSGVRAVGGWTWVSRTCLFKVPGTCAGVGVGVGVGHVF